MNRSLLFRFAVDEATGKNAGLFTSPFMPTHRYSE